MKQSKKIIKNESEGKKFSKKIKKEKAEESSEAVKLIKIILIVVLQEGHTVSITISILSIENSYYIKNYSLFFDNNVNKV